MTYSPELMSILLNMIDKAIGPKIDIAEDNIGRFIYINYNNYLRSSLFAKSQ